jgi:hypothetical protein
VNDKKHDVGNAIRGSISIEQLYFSHIMGELIFSTAPAEFMDYLGCENIDKLFSLHRDSLSRKNIFSKEELMQIIRIDFEKMIFSLLEMRNKSSRQLISDFFGKDVPALLAMLPELEKQPIYHLGFEVNQPMDLILYSFDYWIRKFNHHFSDGKERFRIVKLLRFPASIEFQKRVNAYVEIMRIWIELDHKEKMLELFDIYHPVSPLTASGKREIIVQTLPNESRTDYNEAIARLLSGDTIWHYAIYLDHPLKVEKLHASFRQLAEDRAEYELPFLSLVNNKHDGSLYTKIINRKKRMELEFVTELDLKASFGKSRKPEGEPPC